MIQDIIPMHSMNSNSHPLHVSRTLLSSVLRLQNFIDTKHRRYRYTLQRFLGVPEKEARNPLEYDGKSLCMCPYTHVFDVYVKCLGKRIKMLVPCGKCLYCRHKSQNALIYRMINHNRMYKHSLYVTLTYDDAHLPFSVEDARLDITKFIKRFRKEFNDKTFSYYLVCERGDLRDRIHFHLLIWWNGPCTTERVFHLVKSKWCAPVRNFHVLSELLEYKEFVPTPTPVGFVYVDDEVNGSIASYVSKYVTNIEKKLLFRSWSHGLGALILSLDDDLVAKMRYLNIIEYQPKDKKYSIPVPKYYQKKVFSQSELDCLFADYLVSDDYARKWEFYESDKFKNLIDIYKEYEKRCIDKYKARCQLKAKLKRLL